MIKDDPLKSLLRAYALVKRCGDSALLELVKNRAKCIAINVINRKLESYMKDNLSEIIHFAFKYNFFDKEFKKNFIEPSVNKRILENINFDDELIVCCVQFGLVINSDAIHKLKDKASKYIQPSACVPTSHLIAYINYEHIKYLIDEYYEKNPYHESDKNHPMNKLINELKQKYPKMDSKPASVVKTSGSSPR